MRCHGGSIMRTAAHVNRRVFRPLRRVPETGPLRCAAPRITMGVSKARHPPPPWENRTMATTARKLTATHAGVTVTRRSPRPYTHCVMGLWDWTGYPDERAQRGHEWRAVSWHQGVRNAMNGYAAALKDNVAGRWSPKVPYLELVLVHINEQPNA